MFCRTPRGLCHANDVWSQMLDDITKHGSRVVPRGLPCQEILSYTSTIDMTTPVVSLPGRALGRRFMVAEAWWILSGRNDVESIEQYSTTVAKFSNDGKRFDGAYGVKIVDQLRYVCDTLVADNYSRQAVISIWRENPRPSRDIPCTIACQFLIRQHDGQRYLDCCDYMRSSDAWLGIVYDWFNFSMLSAYVLLTIGELDESLKDIKLGRLHLTAGSAHLYESDANKAYTVLSHREHVVKYSPLNLEEFADGGSLVQHLGRLKDRRYVAHRWLTDLVTAPSGESLFVAGV